MNFVLEKSGTANPPEDYLKHLKEKIRIYCLKLGAKWSECFRNTKVFMSRNMKWLNSEVLFKKVLTEVPSISKAGRNVKCLSMKC